MSDVNKEEFYVAGVDVGSTTAKAIILNSKLEVIGKSLQEVTPRVAEDAETSFVKACKDAGRHISHHAVSLRKRRSCVKCR